MKGLLRKEGYLIRSYCRMFLIFSAAAAVAVAVFGERLMLMLLYSSIMVGVLPSTVSAYDEKEHWDRYSATLPVSRAQIVAAKYLVPLLLCAALLVLDALAMGACALFRPGYAFAQPLSTLGLLFTVTLVFPALMLPIIFRMGAEKGKVLYLVICAVVAGVCGAFGVFLFDDDGGPSLFSTLSGWVIPAMMAVAAALFVLSWRLSVAFYKKREL